MFFHNRIRSFYQIDGDSGTPPGDTTTPDTVPPPANPEAEKYKQEIARLGKLLNEHSEKEKQRALDEAKKIEEEAIKKGEFETLANDYRTKYESISTEYEKNTNIVKQYEEYFQNEFEKSIKDLSKEDKELITNLVGDKSAFEKNTLVKPLLEKFVQKGFGANPKSTPTPVSEVKTDFLKKGDILGSLQEKLNRQK